MYYNGLFNIIHRKQKQMNISTNIKSLFDNLIRHFQTLSDLKYRLFFLFFNPFSGPDWYLVRVELTVTDVNDNIPEWSMVPAPYLAVVSPEASAGSLVYKLNAQDGDEGNNGEVEYFLSDGMLFLLLFSCMSSHSHFVSKKSYFYDCLPLVCAPIIGFASIENHYDMKGIGFASNITVVSK